jgi:TrpR-related protein YerC/YecD
LKKSTINHKEFFEAIAALKGSDEAERFLMDLCTPQEIEIFKDRFAVCRLLYSGTLTYREISKMTNVSTTTISRVARFLNGERYRGYKSILERISNEKKDVEKVCVDCITNSGCDCNENGGQQN